MNYYRITIDNGFGLEFVVFITGISLIQLNRQTLEVDGVIIDFGLDIVSWL